MKNKIDLDNWDGHSVSDIATIIQESGKAQKTDISSEHRAPFFLRTHPAKLIAMDAEKNLISSDGKTIMSLDSAHWELTFESDIKAHVELLYPDEIEKKGMKFRSGLLKSGKLAYLGIGVEVFSIFEATKKNSLPGDRTPTTLTSYLGGQPVGKPIECDTFIKALDEHMFALMYSSIQDD